MIMNGTSIILVWIVVAILQLWVQGVWNKIYPSLYETMKNQGDFSVDYSQHRRGSQLSQLIKELKKNTNCGIM